jgi:hypothetical protein
MSTPWWAAFGPAEAAVSCGGGTHTLRWADGSLIAIGHPDAEGELVLAALGGDSTPCLDLVRAWGRHSDDLSVLALGPRSASDRVTVTAEMLDEVQARLVSGWAAPVPIARSTATFGAATRRRSGWTGSTPMRLRTGSARQMAARRSAVSRLVSMQHVTSGAGGEDDRADLLRLFDLGEPFQWRLAGAVAHAWSADGEHAGTRDRARPALAAALTGRLAPAAADWLDVDPAGIEAVAYDGGGWGELSVSSASGVSHVRARLPVSWLATVWAPGFAVVEGVLIVRLLDAAWPSARVLALRAPGDEPVELSIRHDKGHWSVAAS